MKQPREIAEEIFKVNRLASFIWKEDVIKALESYGREQFEAGMKHVTTDRSRVSIHGTDGCANCDDGRITIYAAHRWCVECQHAQKEVKP